jgi:hypothetical protein
LLETPKGYCCIGLNYLGDSLTVAAQFPIPTGFQHVLLSI